MSFRDRGDTGDRAGAAAGLICLFGWVGVDAGRSVFGLSGAGGGIAAISIRAGGPGMGLTANDARTSAAAMPGQKKRDGCERGCGAGKGAPMACSSALRNSSEDWKRSAGSLAR